MCHSPLYYIPHVLNTQNMTETCTYDCSVFLNELGMQLVNCTTIHYTTIQHDIHVDLPLGVTSILVGNYFVCGFSYKLPHEELWMICGVKLQCHSAIEKQQWVVIFGICMVLAQRNLFPLIMIIIRIYEKAYQLLSLPA